MLSSIHVLAERAWVLTEVEEELGEDVERQKTALAQAVVAEADDGKEDGEDDETHNLDGLAAELVHCRYCTPVSRDGTGANEHQLANGCVVEPRIHILPLPEADGSENGASI